MSDTVHTTMTSEEEAAIAAALESDEATFNFIATKLLEQSKRSVADDNGGSLSPCYYRHPAENLKCAAGFCIPDSLYDSSMETRGAGTVAGQYEEVQTLWGDRLPLIQSLQTIHDSYSPQEWPCQLANLAGRMAYKMNFLHLLDDDQYDSLKEEV